VSKDIVTKDHWSKYADDYASKETVPSAQFISTRNGEFHLGDEDLGTEMCVIITDVVREYTYYEGRYDPNNPEPPRCYAFGRDEESMVPGMFYDVDKGKETERDLFAEKDPNGDWFEAQAESCAECPMAEWGSSDTGRGKACQQRRRLSVIPAGVFKKNKKTKEVELELFDDPEDLAEVDMAYMKVPVTSTKHWAKYLKAVAQMGRPPFGVITRVWLEKTDNQFELQFEMVEELPEELIGVVMERHEEARRTIVQPYRPPEENAPTGVRGLKGKKKGGRR